MGFDSVAFTHELTRDFTAQEFLISGCIILGVLIIAIIINRFFHEK